MITFVLELCRAQEAASAAARAWTSPHAGSCNKCVEVAKSTESAIKSTVVNFLSQDNTDMAKVVGFSFPAFFMAVVGNLAYT